MAKNFMLHIWGGFFNDEHQEKHGIEEGYYWFKNARERAEFLAELQVVEAHLDARMLAYTMKNGSWTRRETTASMVFVFNGKEYPHQHTWGYGYPVSAAHFMFEEGNYSCDCNKSLMIGRDGVDFPEMDCGDEIKLKDFKVTLSKPTKKNFEPSVN